MIVKVFMVFIIISVFMTMCRLVCKGLQGLVIGLTSEIVPQRRITSGESICCRSSVPMGLHYRNIPLLLCLSLATLQLAVAECHRQGPGLRFRDLGLSPGLVMYKLFCRGLSELLFIVVNY